MKKIFRSLSVQIRLNFLRYQIPRTLCCLRKYFFAIWHVFHKIGGELRLLLFISMSKTLKMNIISAYFDLMNWHFHWKLLTYFKCQPFILNCGTATHCVHSTFIFLLNPLKIKFIHIKEAWMLVRCVYLYCRKDVYSSTRWSITFLTFLTLSTLQTRKIVEFK